MLFRKLLIVILSICLTDYLSSDAFSQSKKICFNKINQKMSVKTKCSKAESLFSSKKEIKKLIKSQPRTGPKGPKGSAGASGSTGNKGSAGSAGFTGAKGSQGFTGVKGPSGLNGDSYYDPLRSGNGAFGVVGGDYDTNANNGSACVTIIFPFSVPAAPTDAIVKRLYNGAIGYCGSITCCGQNPIGSCCGTVGNLTPENCYSSAESSQQIQELCNGTDQNPTASPGVVCFYPVGTWNARDISAQPIANGFKVCWNFDGEYVPEDEDTFVKGVWAYTAP